MPLRASPSASGRHDIQQERRNAGVGQVRGNARAHGPGAQDSHFFNMLHRVRLSAPFRLEVDDCNTRKMHTRAEPLPEPKNYLAAFAVGNLNLQKSRKLQRRKGWRSIGCLK